MAAASRSESVAVGLEARFPFGFQGLLDQCLMGAVAHDRDTERALFWFAGLGYPNPPHWLCFSLLHVLGVNRFGQRQAFGWSEGFHTINACRFLALVVLRHPPHGQQL